MVPSMENYGSEGFGWPPVPLPLPGFAAATPFHGLLLGFSLCVLGFHTHYQFAGAAGDTKHPGDLHVQLWPQGLDVRLC